MNERQFLSLALANEKNRTILARLSDLGLEDCWLVSGSLFQAVWNGLTGRAMEHGIKDYDVFYFDTDTSFEAEDRAIAKARDLFSPLGLDVELRNQARVHLWYEAKFGTEYPQLRSSCEGIDRFLAPTCMVGIAPDMSVYAPHGFDDIETMTVRPNRMPNFSAERYTEKAVRWRAMWPELTVMPA